MPRPDGRVLSVCTLVYTQTLYYSTPFLSHSSPLQMTSILSEQLCTLADGCLLMYSVADRDRYLLHQQLMGAGSGCTVTNSVQQDIPSVPVECAVCFAHPVTHLCAHASLASTSGLLDQHKVWLARPPQQVWLARPSQHKSGLLDHLSTSLAC